MKPSSDEKPDISREQFFKTLRELFEGDPCAETLIQEILRTKMMAEDGSINLGNMIVCIAYVSLMLKKSGYEATPSDEFEEFKKLIH